MARLGSMNGLSRSPQNAQVGMCLILSADFRSPEPQTGAIAAHLFGCAAARLQVPMPPSDRPVRYTRFESILYSFCTSSSMASARSALGPPANQFPFVEHCGKMTKNGNDFSLFL